MGRKWRNVTEVGVDKKCPHSLSANRKIVPCALLFVPK